MPPLKYTADDFKAKVEEYFIFVNEENKQRKLQRFAGEKLKPYTLSGLCVYLDISRETWREYSERPGHADVVKKARIIVENYVEEGLLNGTINPIGGIFNLKNNFQWVDKIDIEANTGPKQLDAIEVKKKLLEIKGNSD